MRNRRLWYDATLVTLNNENDFGIVPEGALITENEKIVWIGKTKDIKEDPSLFSERICVHHKLLTPGLIDCHTHLVYAGNRAKEWQRLCQGERYENLLKEGGGIVSTVKATREASEEDLLSQSLKHVKAMLSQGVTTVEIKSGYGLDKDTELKILRVASQLPKHCDIDVKTTFLGAHCLPPEFSHNNDYIDYIINTILPELDGVDAIDGYCESIAFSNEQLDKLFSHASKRGLRIKLHCDQFCSGRGASLIEKYKGLSADHLDYLDEQGVLALKRSGAVAVLLPGAQYFLNQKTLPPIERLRQHNVPMAIATDCNPGTSPTTSLPLMMNMACVHFRLTPLEALQAVTLQAAKALGVESDRGSLMVGKLADFVVWDAKDPIELCYYFGTSLCQSVIKRGERVYENAFS